MLSEQIINLCHIKKYVKKDFYKIALSTQKIIYSNLINT